MGIIVEKGIWYILLDIPTDKSNLTIDASAFSSSFNHDLEKYIWKHSSLSA